MTATKKKPPKTTAKKNGSKTTITCNAEGAETVFVAGSFNGWNPSSTPMEKGTGGLWKTDLNLAPGQYEFKFIVDGEWCCEPGCVSDHLCPNCVPNGHGTMNRLLKVAE